MYAAKYIFSSKFFVAWMVVSIIWVWGTMLIATFYPIIDGWDQISLVCRGISGLGKKKPRADSVEVVEAKEIPESVVKDGSKDGSENGASA